MTRRLLSLLLALVLVIGTFVVLSNRGLLSLIGVQSESHDSQVIQAIERTQEVSLLSLFTQGIKENDQVSKILGKDVPFTGKKVFLQYSFKAKLGIDGAQVKLTKTSEKAYLISVPEFIFIGYDQPTFKVAAEDGSLLSWTAPEIDKIKMINEILSERQKYILSNQVLLKEQTKVFYERLITSIDPGVVTTFEFTP